MRPSGQRNRSETWQRQPTNDGRSTSPSSKTTFASDLARRAFGGTPTVSKKDGQLRPLLVLRDGTLIAGERTLRAAKLAGLTHVEVKVLEGDLSPREIKKLQLIENLMREGLSDAEIYLACQELMELHPDWLKKDLAAELHFDPSMMTRIFAVDELIPEAKEQFLAGAFGFSKAYAIAKGSRDDQRRKLAEILAGASRDDVERRGRMSDGASQVKLSRVKIAMPEGASVVVSGTRGQHDPADRTSWRHFEGSAKGGGHLRRKNFREHDARQGEDRAKAHEREGTDDDASASPGLGP